jgi:integrase
MFGAYSNKTIHPHLLRHYVGTKIYKNSDHDINKVQKQLRHKNINTSIKYYVGDDEEDLKNVLDSF